MNPLAYSMRPTYHKTNNPVKQRVMSAKLLKLRQLQSQLNDANFHLAEVARENQTLKTLQKRQDKALSKYENTNAELPRLIHSHEEEIRVLTERNKTMKKAMKELTEQLKQKEEELTRTREQLSHLERLNKDRHLLERETLMEQMEDYKIKLQKSEEQVTVLNRKLMLENKTSRQRLNVELLKHKQCQKELLHAFDEIDRLTGLLDAKENMVRPRNPKFNKFQTKESISMGSLPRRNLSNEKLISRIPVTDVKLQPISNEKDNENFYRKNENGFKMPMENIMQRLSSGSARIPAVINGNTHHSSDTSLESRDNSAGSLKSRPNSSMRLEKLPSVQENHRVNSKMKPNESTKKEDDIKYHSERDEGLSDDGHSCEEVYVEHKDVVVVRYDHDRNTRNDTNDNNNNGVESRLAEPTEENQLGNSSEEDVIDVIQKLRKNKHEEERVLQKPQGIKRRSLDETNTSRNLQSEKDIQKMAESLDMAIQKASQNSKNDFDKNLSTYCSDVLNNVKGCNKAIEAHKESLKHSKNDTETLLDTLQKTEKIETKLKHSFFNVEDDDIDFVKEILDEEHKFQLENKIKNSNRDENSNTEKKSLVNLENKRKLLATLRAIDNGDSVESIEEPKPGNVRKEMFGKVAH